MRRAMPMAVLAAGVVLLVGIWLGRPSMGVFDASARPKTIVFVVLDTVRAQSTSLCGYERPTTPILEDLASRGAVFSCAGVVPGGWTMPSHASFFTGLEVPDHGVWRRSGEDHSPRAGAWPVVPLGPGPETLAEALGARGYQTVGVAGNAAFVESSGLQRGFDVFGVTPTWFGADAWRGERLDQALDERLAALDPEDGPLFLFVNIMDAHDPYPAVPAEAVWGPPQPVMRFQRRNADSRYQRFLRGELPDEVSADFLGRVRNGYDQGVREADASLGRLLGTLADKGWLEGGVRLVVTSDHGEHLGEDQLLGHGASLHEVNQRVPILIFDSSWGDVAPVAFPDGPVSASVVYDLVRFGRVEPRPIRAALAPHHAMTLQRTPIAALWRGADKLWASDGVRHRYDLSADPLERFPLEIGVHEAAEDFSAWVTRVEREARVEGHTPDALSEQLEAMGYVESEPTD